MTEMTNATTFETVASYALPADSDQPRLLGGKGPVTQYQTGWSGDDTLLGAAERDNISGGKGDDLIRGGDGEDVLTGGKGNDRLFGDAGDDVFHEYRSDTGTDEIDGGQGDDTVWVTGLSDDFDQQTLADGALRLTNLNTGHSITLRNVEHLYFDEPYSSNPTISGPSNPSAIDFVITTCWGPNNVIQFDAATDVSNDTASTQSQTNADATTSHPDLLGVHDGLNAFSFDPQAGYPV